jgi:hypothetical protein
MTSHLLFMGSLCCLNVTHFLVSSQKKTYFDCLPESALPTVIDLNLIGYQFTVQIWLQLM